jgi:glycosyltransferase involved in cell wall biosynthesis
LIHEVDRLIGSMPAERRPNVRLFLPRKRSWSPSLEAIALTEIDGASSQLWEQLRLPRLAADGVLVNLCNLAPILHRRKILMLHDVQFLMPDSSYPLRQRLGYRLLVPMMARTSRQVLTVSNYSRQMLDLFGIAPRARCRVVHNGVDHMLAAEPARPALYLPRPFVLIFGSPKAYKNVAVVFSAFADARLADLDLVVVGPSEAQLRSAGLTPPDGALFVGRPDDGALRWLYEHAVCLAFPSRTEGFGLPPLEAMMCGCPAVVTPAGAIPEACRDAACYADVDDPASWVSSIRRLADDADLRARKLAQSAERSAAFTWARAGEELMDSILALADEPRA